MSFFKIVMVGMRFREDSDTSIHNYKVSEKDNGKLFFVEEPDNKYDKNAVQIVIINDNTAKQIGYVSKEYNKMCKLLLQKKRDGICDYNIDVENAFKASASLIVNIIKL